MADLTKLDWQLLELAAEGRVAVLAETEWYPIAARLERLGLLKFAGRGGVAEMPTAHYEITEAGRQRLTHPNQEP